MEATVEAATLVLLDNAQLKLNVTWEARYLSLSNTALHQKQSVDRLIVTEQHCKT